jgi:long-chain fatty acid transport protein
LPRWNGQLDTFQQQRYGLPCLRRLDDARKESFMKRQVALHAAATALLVAQPALAANKNQSAEFSRTLNRNASTDADASYFNPAGLAFLPEDGLYVSAANQFIFITNERQDRSELLSRLHPDTYTGKTEAWLYPTLHVAYRFKEDFAAYFNFLPIGGGGGGRYEDGIPFFDAALANTLGERLRPLGAELTTFNRDLYFDGVAYNLSWSAGLAYRFHKRASVALGYRLIYAFRQFSGYARNMSVETSVPSLDGLVNDVIRNDVGDNDFVSRASSFGRTILGGVHLQPVDELNIGLRFEQSGPLVLENETTITGNSTDIRALFQTTAFADGKRTRQTDPVQLAAGVSYLFFEKLKLEADVTYAFNSQVDLGGAEEDRQDDAFMGLAAEYALLPALELSAGYAYSTPYLKPEGWTDNEAGTASHNVAGGVTCAILPSLDVTVGVTYAVYPTQEASVSPAPGGGIQSAYQDTVDIGLGLSYRPTGR